MFEFIEREYAFTLLVLVLTAAMFFFSNQELTYMIVGAFVGFLTKSDKKVSK